MAKVMIQTTIDCEVNSSEAAHQLGRELEDRLHSVITQLLPNLRYAENIRDGSIRFHLEITGRRVNISAPEKAKKK